MSEIQGNELEEFTFPSDFSGLTHISERHVVRPKPEYIFLITEYLRLQVFIRIHVYGMADMYTVYTYAKYITCACRCLYVYMCIVYMYAKYVCTLSLGTCACRCSYVYMDMAYMYVVCMYAKYTCKRVCTKYTCKLLYQVYMQTSALNTHVNLCPKYTCTGVYTCIQYTCIWYTWVLRADVQKKKIHFLHHLIPH